MRGRQLLQACQKTVGETLVRDHPRMLSLVTTPQRRERGLLFCRQRHAQQPGRQRQCQRMPRAAVRQRPSDRLEEQAASRDVVAPDPRHGLLHQQDVGIVDAPAAGLGNSVSPR
jgi:hypothetical protein